MTPAVRFAPSPTGRIHVGNARIALLNWLFARAHGGSFLLRLDDTDLERSTEAYAQAILNDLEWLGLDWDRLERQSLRLDRYAAVAERLKASGRLYPCYETAEELAAKRAGLRAQGLPPVYDRAALALDAPARAALENAGRKPHWRFRLDPGTVTWTDLVKGAVEIPTGSLSDPVLIREDGSPLYTFSSVVDDIDFAISHVVRGEDHVSNTAVQWQLFQALGGPVPEFAHLGLLVGAKGEPLSKRFGALSIEALRAQGIEAMAVNSLLARLGSADPVQPAWQLEELLAGFDFGKFGRAAAAFDVVELKHLNARILHEMPYDGVAARLRPALDGAADERFWLAVRSNVASLDEAVAWWRVLKAPLAPRLEEPDFLRQAAAALPEGPFDGDTWGRWTAALKAATGRKGRALFHPLRLALTGREDGPEMRNLLPLIDPERARARLRGETA